MDRAASAVESWLASLVTLFFAYVTLQTIAYVGVSVVLAAFGY